MIASVTRGYGHPPHRQRLTWSAVAVQQHRASSAPARQVGTTLVRPAPCAPVLSWVTRAIAETARYKGSRHPSPTWATPSHYRQQSDRSTPPGTKVFTIFNDLHHPDADQLRLPAATDLPKTVGQGESSQSCRRTRCYPLSMLRTLAHCACYGRSCRCAGCASQVSELDGGSYRR